MKNKKQRYRRKDYSKFGLILIERGITLNQMVKILREKRGIEIDRQSIHNYAIGKHKPIKPEVSCGLADCLDMDFRDLWL